MLGTHFSVGKYFEITTQILSQLPEVAIERLAEAIYSAWEDERSVFLCGSEACVRSLQEGFNHNVADPTELTKPLNIYGVTDQVAAILNWLANEKSKDGLAATLDELAAPGDLLIALSEKDHSSELAETIEWANSAGLVTWSLTGHEGARLRNLAQHTLRVPLKDRGIVGSLHMLLMHWVIDDVSARIRQQGRYAQMVLATEAS